MRCRYCPRWLIYIHLWAKYHREVRLPMITHRIRRASFIFLVGIRPSLTRGTIPWEADLPFTCAVLRPCTNSYVFVASLHNADIVGGTVLPLVVAVSKLEQGLRKPLPGGALFSMSAEAHSYIVEIGRDWHRFPLRNVHGIGALDHLEVTGYLIERNLLGPWALISRI